jgi:hypothetical protein
MTRKEALIELRDKVAAGDASTMRFDDVFGDGCSYIAELAYFGSLDAALALHDAVLPGWCVTCLDQACNLAGDPWGCEVAYFDGSNPSNNRKAYSQHDHSNPARALLLAILSALIAECEE